MTEHIRHSPGKRNRRKTAHHVDCYRGEVEAMWSQLAALRKLLAKMDDSARYLEGRLSRTDNRLKAERG